MEPSDVDPSEGEQRARARYCKNSLLKNLYFQFREERRQIVERYDQGREDGAVFDDWEDPKLEIYHTQDR